METIGGMFRAYQLKQRPAVAGRVQRLGRRGAFALQDVARRAAAASLALIVGPFVTCWRTDTAVNHLVRGSPSASTKLNAVQPHHVAGI
jgi:hypothetical protein